MSNTMSTSDTIQLTIAIITGFGVLVTIFTPIINAFIRYINKAKLKIIPSEICNTNPNGDRFIRVAVQNLGNNAARNVHVKVCWGNAEQIPPIPATWTHINDLNCAYISKRAPEYADIAIDFANKTDFMLSTYLNVTDASNIKSTNDVLVRIIAYADNADLVEQTIRFRRNANGEMHGAIVDM